MRKFGKYEKMPDGTKSKQPAVKSALLQTYFTSLICLVLCVTMFFGTTFAWFTSEVTNSGNEIYIGTLDVDLVKQNKDNTWTSLNSEAGSTTKLFDKGIYWEPGYTALETVKVKDQGDLAFRYEMTFAKGSEVDDAAAAWFDVWCYHNPQNEIPEPENYAQITEANGWTYVGSLADVLSGKAVFKGEMDKEAVAANEEHIYTIALHMNGEKVTEDQQDDLIALMGKKISLNVKLVATQLSSEQDAFDDTYDSDKVTAKVTNLGAKAITYNAWIGQDVYEMTLNTAYQFEPIETSAEVQDSPYKDYVADFVVYADKDVPANSVALAGYYRLFCEDYNDGHWVAMQSGEAIPAGYEVSLIRGGWKITYDLLCELGHDGIGFRCGIANFDDSNIGTTVTVELRLYELDAEGNETGEYIVCNRVKHTFQTTTADPVPHNP